MSSYYNINSFLKENDVKLIAVSKTKPIDLIQDFYDKGHRLFGENRVNELVEKHNALPKDIEWHMIGHLQKNKVKYIAPFVDLIHSVDNVKLATTIDKEAKKNERIVNILLQVKIAEEETKTGFGFDILLSKLPELQALTSIKIIGLMGMGTFTNDDEITEKEFVKMHGYFNILKQTVFRDNPEFKELSMGMSGDYKIAVKNGSTMVRIGSLLFGKR